MREERDLMKGGGEEEAGQQPKIQLVSHLNFLFPSLLFLLVPPSSDFLSFDWQRTAGREMDDRRNETCTRKVRLNERVSREEREVERNAEERRGEGRARADRREGVHYSHSHHHNTTESGKPHTGNIHHSL